VFVEAVSWLMAHKGATCQPLSHSNAPQLRSRASRHDPRQYAACQNLEFTSVFLYDRTPRE
jgi:hypothetical protein